MLIANKPKDGDIVTLKMFSGEEVLAKLVSADTDHYKVSRPIILAPNPSQPGQIVAAPFVATAEPAMDVEIQRQHVVSLMKTNTHFTKQYLEITTGLKMASGLPPINEKAS